MKLVNKHLEHQKFIYIREWPSILGKMKKYTFFPEVRLRFRRLIERFKRERSNIDRMTAKTTESIKKQGAWLTGAKLRNWPRPYTPFDRSNNEKSRRMFFSRDR